MISKNKQECLKLYDEGLQLYRKKQFNPALAKFKKALEFVPDDGPSKLFIERCEYFIKNPVTDDWDGVFTMKTK